MRLTPRLCCSITKKIGEITKKYANLPESYLERACEQVEWKTPDLPQYLPRTVKRRSYQFGVHRPWTDEFKRENEGPEYEPTWVEPILHWPVFKGDRVEILVGRDKGKHGIVAQVYQERNWVIVAGLNWRFKWVGKTNKNPGTVVRDEQPLLVTTEVCLVDPADNKPCKFEWRYLEDGERVRVSLRTGRIIPMPHAAEETYDYKSRKTYLESDKDTVATVIEKITFQPKLKTFEMDVMEAMGIVEDRIPKKSYWY